MTVKIEIPGEPVGKQRPRASTGGGKFARMYTPGKTVEYENLVKMAWCAAGAEPFEEGVPLEIDIIAYMAIPKSASKAKVDKMKYGIIRPCKKPDIDNIVKIICDGLNKIAWHDDSQVVKVTAEKWYTLGEMTPRVAVQIKECE